MISAQSPFRTATEADAPWSAADSLHTHSTQVFSYLTGNEAVDRPVGYGENSWLSSVIVLMLIVLALNFNNYRRLFKNFSQDLFSLRRRSNAFDERTSNETRSYALIILMLCLSEGLLLFASGHISSGFISADNVFGATMAMSAMALALYLFQLGSYQVVGFTFTDKISAHQWLRGFNASQALLSLLLLGPALVAIYYPTEANLMFIIGCLFYFSVRITFICKGFRIFYHNLFSLLYFILYLCTLEITPLVILYRIAVR